MLFVGLTQQVNFCQFVNLSLHVWVSVFVSNKFLILEALQFYVPNHSNGSRLLPVIMFA